MKLLVITPYFYPKVGGLENYALSFSRGLIKKYKWNVVVITSNHKARKDIVETIEGMKIYRLAPLFKLSNTPINPFWYFKMKKIIQSEKPDLINAHTPVPFMADVGGLTAGSIPFFVTYHAYTLLKYKSFFLNILIRFYKLPEFFLFRKAKKILLVSKAITATIPKQFQEKIIIINNALEKNDIPKTYVKKNHTTMHLVFIGSLDKTHNWKGLDNILYALQLTKKTIQRDIHLSIIGDGNNMNHFKTQATTLGIEKQIVFVGRKEGKEKQKILQTATHAIIYPKSSNDAFPTVLLEYWANKIPVIAANITPLNKFLTHKKSAYLVAPNNPSALAKALSLLSKNKTMGATIANSGYTELQTKYLLDEQLKKFQTTIQFLTL